MRNVETLECRPAPIFDSGNCLWFDVDDYDLQHRTFNAKSKQFYESPAKQLLLVDDFSILKKDRLEGFVKDAMAIFSQNPLLKGRLELYEELLTEKVDHLLSVAAFA